MSTDGTDALRSLVVGVPATPEAMTNLEEKIDVVLRETSATLCQSVGYAAYSGYIEFVATASESDPTSRAVAVLMDDEDDERFFELDYAPNGQRTNYSPDHEDEGTRRDVCITIEQLTMLLEDDGDLSPMTKAVLEEIIFSLKNDVRPEQISVESVDGTLTLMTMHDGIKTVIDEEGASTLESKDWFSPLDKEAEEVIIIESHRMRGDDDLPDDILFRLQLSYRNEKTGLMCSFVISPSGKRSTLCYTLKELAEESECDACDDTDLHQPAADHVALLTAKLLEAIKVDTEGFLDEQ